MSAEPDSPASSSSTVRFRIIAVSVAMAFLLYLHRICLSEVVKSDSFLADFPTASKEEIGRVLASFFLAYALFQVPAGWLSDRFGGRLMLCIYIAAWSILTGYSGMASGLGVLLIARFALGIAQSGAYSTSSGVIRNWFGPGGRAAASSYVSIGGRLGGTLAPLLTTTLILWFGGWRSVLLAYCVAGLVVAVAYWILVRDRPEHPESEDEETAESESEIDRASKGGFRDVASLTVSMLSSRSLWLNSLAQFCLVFGWAYLITWLPTYLKEQKGVDDFTGSLMVSFVLGVGIVGQLIGGRIGNVAVKRLGTRWGRSLPLACTCFIAGFAYLGCAGIDSVWLIVGLCAIVSLMTDIGNPTVWAFMQDIGGRNTAAVFGWGNMWGNFGASASAAAVPILMSMGGETLTFLTCAGMYFVASLAALGMDATLTVRKQCD